MLVPPPGTCFRKRKHGTRRKQGNGLTWGWVSFLGARPADLARPSELEGLIQAAAGGD